MNTSLKIELFVLTLVFIVNFYFLYKSKVKILTCIWDSIVICFYTLIISLISGALLKYIFDIPYPMPVILGSIFGIIFFYFKLKGTKIIKGKIKKEKVAKEKPKSEKEELKEKIGEAAMGAYFVAVVTFGWTYFAMKEGLLLSIIDPIIISLLGYWIYSRYSFYATAIMTTYFIVGKLMFMIPMYEAGYSGGAGIGGFVIFGYLFIRGTYAAFLYNFDKTIKK